MRVPLSWLSEFVSLPEDATPERVHADLVRVGFEEESIRRFDVTGPIVVGEVLSRHPEEHSNGKTVNWCQVRVAAPGETAADGGEDVRGIVCGAHNFDAGDKVVVTLPGAVLPGGFEIAARKTYGHTSDGMIASARELSLGEEHDGIIVLARLGLDAEVGSDAKALLGLDDTAVEINVTPDRGYAFSVRGVAREYGHATGAEFRDPALAVAPATATGFPVSIDDAAPIRGRIGASGFVTRVVRGIDPSRPTPAWMVSRLQLAGIRSLSLEVDISNYVMLELGQPLHAYDLSKLSGGITVRRAADGETLVTLDGQERKLHPEDLVIADESGAIGLAGVMGGESTKTDESTVDVLVEAATFDPVSIARTARRHKLPSEASKRFERTVDPLVARAAAQRMVDLLVELAGGTEGELGSEIVAPWAPAEVRLPLARINGLLGTDYSDDEARDAIATIGCDVDVVEGALVVTPPSWRSDLGRPADLIEEVARIVGYDRIPSVLPVAPAGRGLTREQRLRRRAANVVTAAGLDEVQSYPFVSRAQLDAFGAGAETVAPDAESPSPGTVPAVKIANALDAQSPFLRRSLLPGLVTAAQRNVSRGLTGLSLVEFGLVFEPAGDGSPLGTDAVPPLAERPADAVLAELDASIPEQPRRAAGLLLGEAVAKQPGEAVRVYDWANALDAARTIAEAVSAELVVSQGAHRAFHPGRTAELSVRVDEGDGNDLDGDEGGLVVVGVAGELLPELVAEHHLPGRVAAFELDLDRIVELAPRDPETAQLSTYPAATQDLTLVVADDVPAGDVLAVLVAGAGPLLEDAAVVDDYRGAGLDDGMKALTFALRFRAEDRTLTAEEASEAKLAGVAAAELAFEARIRD